MQTFDSESITGLCARIADLERALERLADLPAVQQPLAAELAEAQRRLAILQTGGGNLDVGTSIGTTGDIVGGDKVQIERVSQTVYQIVLAQGDPGEQKALLDQALAELRPLPGRAFDLYQAVAAGLGRANISIAVDMRGRPQLISDPAPHHVSLDPLFGSLLGHLRAAILGPSELASGELTAREVRYRALIVEQFRHLRLDGLSIGTRPIVLPLEQVYVQLRAVAEVPEAADAFTPEERRLLKLLDERHADEAELREAKLRLDALRRERWNSERPDRFPIAQALHDPLKHGLVILGDPGSGKSTLLQFLALSFAEGPDVATARLGVGGADASRLPIFAPLAAYDDMLNATPDLTIQAFLARYYDQRRAAPGLGPVFDAAIAEGRALILLDGLDEVIEERRRLFVAEQASCFVQQVLASGNRVILTSRVYGYRTAPLAADLPHITVLDFRKEEIATFARQWFRAFKRWEGGGGTLATQTELDAQSEERLLLDEIGHNPGVERLAVNPLLLTMLVLLRQQIGTLPQRRITLYDEYVRALILRWEEHRSRGTRLHSTAARVDLKEAEGALIELALWLQQHRPSGTASAADLLELLTIFYLWEDQGLRVNTDRILPPQRRQAEERARQFLHDMRQHSGLLIERGYGVFGFRHLTFQEYFAGRALARMLADERWDRLQPNLHSGRWREPLLLCAARLGVTEQRHSEANALVMQVLEAGSEYEHLLHRDLFLAAGCAADDIGLSLPLLQRIASGLTGLLDARVPAVAHGALERLHGLALLRAGRRARLPEVQRQVIVALLHWQENGWSAEQSEQLARFPVQTDPEVRASLIEHLSERFWGARLLAVRALAPCLASDVAVREAILGCGADLSEYVRHEVLQACIPLVAQDAVLHQHVQQVLAWSDWHTLEAAILALEPLLPAHPELAEAVRRCLDDDADGVRFAAVSALLPLAQPEWDLLDDLIETLASLFHTNERQVSFSDRLALPGQGVPFIPPLLAYLKDENSTIRLVAADLLGPFAESPDVRDALIEHLDDPDWEMGELVVDALADIAEHDPVALAVLYRLIEQDDLYPAVLDRVLWGVQPFLESDERLRMQLLGLLESSSEDVRDTVLRVMAPLATTDPNILEVLRLHLHDPDPHVRSAALDGLKPLLASHTNIRQAVAARASDPEARIQREVLVALVPYAVDDPQAGLVMRQALQQRDVVLRRELLSLLAPAVLSQGMDAQMFADQFSDQTCAEAAIARAAVVLALGLLADDLLVREALIERLGDQDARVRRGTVRALAEQCGQHDHIRQAAQQCLADADPPVVVAAVEVLGRYAGEHTDARAALLEILAKSPPQPVWEALLAVLGPLAATVQDVRSALLTFLKSTSTAEDRRPEAVLKLLIPLVPAANDVRSGVLVYLRQAPKIEWDALVALGAQLPHDPELRAAVMHRLTHLTSYTLNLRLLLPMMAADADVRSTVTGWLNHKGVLFRQTVLATLAELLPAHAELREPVMAMLADPEPEVRGAAISALAPLVPHDPAVAQSLVAALDDVFVVVWEAACTALAPLAPSNPELRTKLLSGLTFTPAKMPIATINALAPLARQDTEVLAALLQRLTDPNSRVRCCTITALAPLAADLLDVRSALTTALTDLDEVVRSRAMMLLAPLAHADSVLRRALCERLSDPSDRVRAEAVAVLTPLAGGDPALREALLVCQNDTSVSVRGRLVWQLVQLEGEAAVPRLVGLLTAEGNLRTVALEALIGCEPRDPAVMLALLPMLEPPKHDRHDTRHRQRLLDAPLAHLIQQLARLIHDEGLRVSVIGLLGSPDWRQRGGAAHVLAATGPEQVRAALPQLLAALDDWRGHESWQSRLAAAAALVNHERFGDQAVALLQEALDAGVEDVLIRNGRIRTQAAQALGRLRALHHRRDIAEQIAGLLSSEQDGTVLDGLYHALSALADAPEPEGGLRL